MTAKDSGWKSMQAGQSGGGSASQNSSPLHCICIGTPLSDHPGARLGFGSLQWLDAVQAEVAAHHQWTLCWGSPARPLIGRGEPSAVCATVLCRVCRGVQAVIKTCFQPSSDRWLHKLCCLVLHWKLPSDDLRCSCDEEHYGAKTKLADIPS